MTAEQIAAKWHAHLLSAEPVDHLRAEAAVRAAYAAAGLAQPGKFIWCASPLEAAWAFLVLVGKTEGYNHAVIQRLERRKKDKAAMAAAQAAVAARFGISESEVEGYFGQPFYNASGSNPMSRQLNEQIADSWIARAGAGSDFLAPHQGGPFRPLHDLEDALHFEGSKRMQVSAYRQALADAANEDIAILAGRSAQHRLYGNLAYREVAIDEALADAGKYQPTALQRAMWTAYEACGLWWPCEQGVVFSERPIAAELATDGPRMRWADGLTLGGEPCAAASARPESTAADPAGTAKVFDFPLPADHAERIAFLRRQAPALPLFDRYLAGEHEEVWRDLVSLGEQALAEQHIADAQAVAYETMERVARNIAILSDRLRTLGYRFVWPGSHDGLFGLRKAKAHEPHVMPAADAFDTILATEEIIGGPLPLSLRAFFEVVGEINFNGDHPDLAPEDSAVAPDPLVVCSADDALAMIESSDREDGDPLLVEFAPDALHKANVSGGNPYSIEVPVEAVDAPVVDGPTDSYFVEYLRHAILGWGGFPGWERAKQVPAQLDALRRDLVAF